jgi:outer membrane protein TolC
MKKITIIVASILMVVTTQGQTRLGLAESKELAIKNNTKLQNGQLEIEAAEQVKKNAFTNYFPQVSANAFGFYAIDPIVKFGVPGGNLPVYDGNPANLATATEFAYFPGIEMELFQKSVVGAVTLTQPIYAGGQVRSGNKLAQLGVDVKKEQQEMTQDEILLATEQQYWQIVSLQEKQKTLLKYEELLESVHTKVSDAYDAGLIIRNDLLKVELKQRELQTNKSKLISGKQLALMQFCHTIGIPYDPDLLLGENMKGPELPETFRVSNQEALTHRSEYRLLEKAAQAQRLQTGMKRGEYLPQMAVGLNGYYFDALQEDFEGSSNGMAFATLSIPISGWWGGMHAIKEHRIKEKIAQNTLEETKGLLMLQMEKSWVDVEEAYRQILIMEDTQKQAEENLKVSQMSYDSGLITVSDLLEAQALLTETSDNLIEAKSQYMLAVTTYQKHTGR